MTAVLVLAGAMIGAPLRYLVDRAVQARHDSLFPWGTFLVNVAGCLIFGALTGGGSALPSTVMASVGVGFCGALTTYSTFGFETLRLLEEHAYFYAAANAIVGVIAGVGAALLGYTTVQALVA